MSYDLQRIQADQMMAEAMAIQVEVEGMKIENHVRLSLKEAPAYKESDFQEKADQIWAISQSLITCTRG